jgi:hypothetical protein
MPAILLIIGAVGTLVMVGVVLHNTAGLLGGYWGGRLLGFEESVCAARGLTTRHQAFMSMNRIFDMTAAGWHRRPQGPRAASTREE